MARHSEAELVKLIATVDPEDHPARMSWEAYLDRELFTLHEELADMREAGSWQALMAGRKIAMTYRKELHHLRRAAAADVDITNIESIITDLMQLPDLVYQDPRIIARIGAASS